MSEPTPVGAGCSLIRLARYADERGLLAVLDEEAGLPFRPARIFLVTDVPPATVRGEHGHSNLHEVMIAVAGSVTVDLDDGTECATVVLDDPTVGLHVPARVWGAQRDFSPGAMLVVLASHPFDPDDYFTDRPAPRQGDDG